MPRIHDGTTVARTRDQVYCDLEGEVALLHVRLGVYFGLDSTGSEIWKRLETSRTFGELRHEVGREFEVDDATLERDLQAFLAELARHGLIELREG